MARERNPNRDKAFEIYKENKGDIDLVEIASQLDTPGGTIRGWKSKDKWDKKLGLERNGTEQKKERNVPQKKKNATKPIDDGTKETMLNENLTHEQRLFCIYYSKSFNATQSYLKAYKCDYETANANGSRLLVNASVREEVQRLQELKRQQIVISEADLVEFHMRIAFADMGDYVEFGKYKVNLKNSNEVDTQLIKEIKEGRDGLTIKLLDRCNSLEWLSRYFLMNPMDKHKIEYDNKILEYERKKVEPEQVNNDSIKDFLKAIKPTEEDMKELFADEEVIEDGEEITEE